MKNIKRVTFKAADVTAENALELSIENGVPTAGKKERDGAAQAKYLKQRFNKGTLIADPESPAINEATGKRIRRPNKGSNAEKLLQEIKKLQAEGVTDEVELAKRVKEKLGLKQLGTAKKYTATTLERIEAHW